MVWWIVDVCDVKLTLLCSFSWVNLVDAICVLFFFNPRLGWCKMINYAITSAQTILLRWITDKCCRFCLETLELKSDWSHVFYYCTFAVNMKITLKVWKWRPTLLLCLVILRRFWHSGTEPRCYFCVACVYQGVSTHNSRMRKGRGLPLLLSAKGMFLLLPQTLAQRPVCPQPTRANQHLLLSVSLENIPDASYKGYNDKLILLAKEWNEICCQEGRAQSR